MKRTFSIFAIVSLTVLFISVGGGESGLQRNPQGISPAQNNQNMKIDADYSKMPLYFIPNQGQIDAQVAYYLQGKDKTIYFTSQGLTYVLKDQGRFAVKLDFVGANGDVRPSGEEKTGAVISYFKGKPEEWKAGLPTYSRIVYKNLWPGIDVAYYGTVDKMKYEFVVHPGSDPSLIRLAYRGAENVSVDGDGRLQIKTPLGGFHDDVPVAYQVKDGRRKEIPLNYQIDAATKSYVYGFEVGDFDQTLPLVLDPAVLAYCGYIGGSTLDEGFGIAADGAGNAYVTGMALSSEDTFPVAVGPDLTYNGGNYDAFVAKINAAGTALLYCGYIGGSGSDEGLAVAVDGAGNAYITGDTFSTEATFPVAAGPDVTFNDTQGYEDAFVAKINAAGTALVYCGYIGGSGHDDAIGIAVDAAGNAYVAGWTTCIEATFPVKIGPDLSYNGADDAFVAKVNAAGTALVYCGYVGGLNSDHITGIAVDAAGNAHVSGYTYSDEATFPVSAGPGLTFSGSCDAFAAKINAAGTALVYCGYIGGSSLDAGMGIALDSSGSVYVAGYTASTEASFPATSGPDLSYNGGSYDAFVAKVNASGMTLVYCGYIGGSGLEEGLAIALDEAGNAYVTGEVSSNEATFPVMVGPDLTFNGNTDAFVARVRADGIKLDYCGYIGGSSLDHGSSIAVDGSGNAYVTGYTFSTQPSFPVTVGPDLTQNGNFDAFVTKVSYFDERISKHAVGDFDGDGTDEVAMDFGAAGIYLYDSGAWTQLTAGNPESLIPANVDGNNRDEIVADLGSLGLWLWDGGALTQLSGANVEGLAAGDADADGADEVVGDFGAVGLWVYNGGIWAQLSGVNADYVMTANLNGTGGDEIIGDFGATGLWLWNSGVWTQLSGVDADYVTAGKMIGTKYLVGDFGSMGLWLWLAGGGWTQLSGVNADYMIRADTNADANDEIIGDFAALGLWSWDSGAWTQRSGVNADYMIRADTNGDGRTEIAVDFGSIGLWIWNTGAWTQLSGVNPEYMLGGDIDGDNKGEIVADFGALGLWLWDDGVWSQISALNPD